MMTLLIHAANMDPFKLDVEDMPKPGDLVVVGRNPRERTDREVNWIEDGVNTIVIPWWRITLIEVLPTAEETEEYPLPFRTD